MNPGPDALSARRDIGQVLLARGLVSQDQLRIARIEQARSSHSLARLLTHLGFISEPVLRRALEESLGRRSVDPVRAAPNPSVLARVSKETARQLRLLPLDHDPDAARLSVVMADPDDIVALDRLKNLFAPEAAAQPLDVEVLLAGEQEILRAIDRHYDHELSIDALLQEVEGDAGTGSAPIESQGQPIVQLVDALLGDAVRRGASDLHFEPEAGFLRVRYRIDGRLRQVRALHHSCWPAMAVRLKVMAGLDIAETRTAQDGRFSLPLGGGPVDFRISSMPTLHGENLVLRILDRHGGIPPLDQLGLTAEQLRQMLAMLARPEGLLLVTGPTGSGKTTTLYALLAHLDAEDINIMTLEDPVEYPMARIRQTAVADGARFGFADGVRALLRQDPDVILVGEVRDADTAAMAFRAAMTGHRVFTTLHANSAAAALPRLRDIGVPADAMAGNILGVIAQRLVRRLCPRCRREDDARDDERPLLAAAGRPRVFRPVGCPACDFQGYRGRVPLFELLPVDEILDDLVVRGASRREIRQAARDRGIATLADDARRRILDGTTSLEETVRAVALDGGA